MKNPDMISEARLAHLGHAFVRLAEIVRVHLRDHQATEDYIQFGPSPADDVADLIHDVADLISEAQA